MRTSIIPGLALAFFGGRAPPGSDLHEYAVDRAASRIYVVTHKSGLLSFLGHEHAIVPQEWTADLCLDEPIPAGARGTLVIQTPSLVIDSDSARALAGLGKGPSQEDVARIQDKMLDADHLAAGQYGEIRLETVALERETGGSLEVRGRITIHGLTRDVELPVQLERLADRRLRLSGVLRIRQRDFGIEPESIGGVVKVSNDVDLHFVLVALPTDRACALAETR
jgi:hypothetical protein